MSFYEEIHQLIQISKEMEENQANEWRENEQLEIRLENMEPAAIDILYDKFKDQLKYNAKNGHRCILYGWHFEGANLSRVHDIIKQRFIDEGFTIDQDKTNYELNGIYFVFE